MLLFDVGILIVDRIKSRLLRTEGAEELSAYWKWIVLNFVFGMICLSAPSPPWFFASLSVNTISIIVFACAFSRTFLDYTLARNLCFRDEPCAPTTPTPTSLPVAAMTIIGRLHALRPDGLATSIRHSSKVEMYPLTL